MSSPWPDDDGADEPVVAEVEREQVAVGDRAANHDLVDAGSGVAEHLQLEVEQLREEGGNLGIGGAAASGEVRPR